MRDHLSTGPVTPIQSAGKIAPILLRDGSAVYVYKSTEPGKVIVIIERDV